MSYRLFTSARDAVETLISRIEELEQENEYLAKERDMLVDKVMGM